MKNVLYGKTIETLRNRFDVTLAKTKKYYLKWTTKASYMSQ